MVEKKKLNLTQEQKDQIFREEMNKKKRTFADNLFDLVSSSAVGLYIILSSILFGVFLPMYVVGTNIPLFMRGFEISPIGVTGITSMIAVMMFMSWMLFGLITVEIYKRKKKRKNKEKRWWEK